MLTRAGVLAAIIVMAGVYGNRVAGSERPVSRQSLASLPIEIGAWHAAGDMAIDDESLGVLGVDDYVNRVYDKAGTAAVSLYIGYYASQRQGDTIHSPQNCLPGAGWQATESGRTTLDLGGRPIDVNRYMVQKGLNRQVVLYWYQGRGRVIANEYANKLWLMVDAARLHRTNGSLVRVVAPVAAANGGVAGADAAATDFARTLYPALSSYLP
jgi:EpsI family protein